MRVRAIAVTQPLPVEGGPRTAEELMVYCARVSSPDNQGNHETGERLLRYCLEHGHWSVFEQASLTVEIETSMAIAEQILRHSSFKFQKFSQRYSVADLGFEEVRGRRQATKNRQSSVDNLSPEEQAEWQRIKSDLEDLCLRAYESVLQAGIAREVARFLLPMSTRTRLYVTGPVRSWIHWIQARTKRDPDGRELVQEEHREIACAVRDRVFAVHFPITARALGWVA